LTSNIHTILVVDDDAAVLRAVTTILASAGYRCIVAENGSAGWEVFRQRDDEIALVITDVLMPVMGGLELAKEIREGKPGAKVLLMTGYADVSVQGARFPLIRKPFLPDRLLAAVRSALGESE
jgi:two-component system, cell cycle sensor histidine kinase and response regulator CckA